MRRNMTHRRPGRYIVSAYVAECFPWPHPRHGGPNAPTEAFSTALGLRHRLFADGGLSGAGTAALHSGPYPTSSEQINISTDDVRQAAGARLSMLLAGSRISHPIYHPRGRGHTQPCSKVPTSIWLQIGSSLVARTRPSDQDGSCYDWSNISWVVQPAQAMLVHALCLVLLADAEPTKQPDVPSNRNFPPPPLHPPSPLAPNPTPPLLSPPYARHSPLCGGR